MFSMFPLNLRKYVIQIPLNLVYGGQSIFEASNGDSLGSALGNYAIPVKLPIMTICHFSIYLVQLV